MSYPERVIWVVMRGVMIVGVKMGNGRYSPNDHNLYKKTDSWRKLDSRQDAQRPGFCNRLRPVMHIKLAVNIARMNLNRV